MYMPFPFQIFQTPTHVAMTFEYAQGVRIVYTNGTPHPKGPIEWWLGDSRGKWDGDTLVVDAVHFTDQTWLDRAGNFHSEALHLVERYAMTGPDHINYEVTIEDPKVFTRPWKMSMVCTAGRNRTSGSSTTCPASSWSRKSGSRNVARRISRRPSSVETRNDSVQHLGVLRVPRGG